MLVAALLWRCVVASDVGVQPGRHLTNPRRLYQLREIDATTRVQQGCTGCECGLASQSSSDCKDWSTQGLQQRDGHVQHSASLVLNFACFASVYIQQYRGRSPSIIC